MPRLVKGTPEAIAWGERMKEVRRAKRQMRKEVPPPKPPRVRAAPAKPARVAPAKPPRVRQEILVKPVRIRKAPAKPARVAPAKPSRSRKVPSEPPRVCLILPEKPKKKRRVKSEMMEEGRGPSAPSKGERIEKAQESKAIRKLRKSARKSMIPPPFIAPLD